MSSMVTITHNDLVPEQLANMRRGPFALPTESEKVEYLMTRVRTDRQRSQFENFGLEHVLSYQRRVSATKMNFMRRNQKGPLGIVRDFWDRTLEGVTLQLERGLLGHCETRARIYDSSLMDRGTNAGRIACPHSRVFQAARGEERLQAIGRDSAGCSWA